VVGGDTLDAKIDNHVKAGLALEAKVETLDKTLAALNSAAVPVYHCFLCKRLIPFHAIFLTFSLWFLMKPS
jgi:hypothetical protein